MKPKIAIISSQFWKEITNNLEKHCLETLEQNGISKDQVDIYKVPGSFEIPLIAKKIAKRKEYAAIIAFGVIHKGETLHFELIANECVRGCMNVSLEYEIPIIFEVLAVYEIKDAIIRAERKNENRGTMAAETALKMIDVLTDL